MKSSNVHLDPRSDYFSISWAPVAQSLNHKNLEKWQQLASNTQVQIYNSILHISARKITMQGWQEDAGGDYGIGDICGCLVLTGFVFLSLDTDRQKPTLTLLSYGLLTPGMKGTGIQCGI